MGKRGSVRHNTGDADTRGGSAAHAPARKPHRRGSGRERVLDSYAEILRNEGAAAATLDEVARRAEISKGGLLHHFGSKEALVEGLLERLAHEADDDVRRVLAVGPDVIGGYLASSATASDEMSQTVMAVIKLVGSNQPNVEHALQTVHSHWLDVLEERLADPVFARLVQLVGDGMYLQALVGNRAKAVDQEVVALLRELAHRGSAD